MFNKRFTTTLQMAVLFVALVMPSSSAYSDHERKSSKKVVDFVVHINEAGVEYNEIIKVDQDKKTILFQVPAHPGVDHSDVLNDFKQNLTMLRFQGSKICYLFPLVKQESTPEKLIRDLDKASDETVIEKRRVDSTWILDGEVTDRSALGEELEEFCAKYPIYHVKETKDSLSVSRIQTTESQRNRKRRRMKRTAPMNKLCPNGKDLNAAYAECSSPKMKCMVTGRACHKYVICNDVGDGRGQQPPPWIRPLVISGGSSEDKVNCYEDHIYRAIVCCEYIC